jgi:hypothetical protein
MSPKMIEQYLLHLERLGYARATVRDRRRVLERFARVRFDLGRFLARLPQSRHSRLFQMTTLRSFLRFAGRPEEADRIPVQRRPYVPPLRPPSVEDVKALFASRDG